MPIFDYACSACGAKKKDIFVRQWDDAIVCDCGMRMDKVPSRFYADTFPADGIFLEHVSAEGKRFHSKKEMKQYAKDNDLQLGALE